MATDESDIHGYRWYSENNVDVELNGLIEHISQRLELIKVKCIAIIDIDIVILYGHLQIEKTTNRLNEISFPFVPGKKRIVTNKGGSTILAHCFQNILQIKRAPIRGNQCRRAS